MELSEDGMILREKYPGAVSNPFCSRVEGIVDLAELRGLGSSGFWGVGFEVD